jgi:hypothetical protein
VPAWPGLPSLRDVYRVYQEQEGLKPGMMPLDAWRWDTRWTTG